MFRQWILRYLNFALAGGILIVSLYTIVFELAKYPIGWTLKDSVIVLVVLGAIMAVAVFFNNATLSKGAAEYGVIVPIVGVIAIIVMSLVRANPTFSLFVFAAMFVIEIFMVWPDK